ncbi:hypothetical protein SBA6_730007 [Candidatus Sulfopaludibacter sp. SbA6]|nr:hypothetical protein SBA6_730007 [Candidatus Sulfopaludibacter sp. SbA6]
MHDFLSTVHELIKSLEDIIIPLTSLVLLGWTAYELIKKKMGF